MGRDGTDGRLALNWPIGDVHCASFSASTRLAAPSWLMKRVTESPHQRQESKNRRMEGANFSANGPQGQNTGSAQGPSRQQQQQAQASMQYMGNVSGGGNVMHPGSYDSAGRPFVAFGGGSAQQFPGMYSGVMPQLNPSMVPQMQVSMPGSSGSEPPAAQQSDWMFVPPGYNNVQSTDPQNEASSIRRSRGNYKCSKCGLPKKGHVCAYQPKIKRRDETVPADTQNASAQVELDPEMTVRALKMQMSEQRRKPDDPKLRMPQGMSPGMMTSNGMPNTSTMYANNNVQYQGIPGAPTYAESHAGMSRSGNYPPYRP